jgi:hypothetical protein
MAHKAKTNKTKTRNNISVGHQYAQANTNNVIKTWDLLQTTGGKDEPKIVFKLFYFNGIYSNSYMLSNMIKIVFSKFEQDEQKSTKLFWLQS